MATCEAEEASEIKIRTCQKIGENCSPVSYYPGGD
jgi:hypothetical protein